MEPTGTPPPPPTAPPPSSGSSSQATLTLVLGIVSVVCCQILGPVAWILGSAELKAIQAGTSAAANEGAAKAGMILGIIATVIFAFSVLWVLFFGGMAVLQAVLQG